MSAASSPAPGALEVRDGFFGSPLPLVLRPGHPKAAHTVTVDCLGRRTVLLEKGGRSPLLVWETALADYAPLLPDRAEAPAVFTVESFLNGVSLGTAQKTVSMRIPEGALAPGLGEGWVTLRPRNPGGAASDRYAAGLSRVEAVFDETKIDPAPLLGARVTGFRLTALGETVSRPPYRSAVLTGPTELCCAVVDSRGLQWTERFSVEPEAYAPPALALRVSRSGRSAAVTAAADACALNGAAACALTVSLRPLDGDFGAEAALRPGETTVLTGLDAARSYECRVRAVDSLGGETVRRELLPVPGWAMKFRPAGDGVAFGMAPSRARVLELPAGWEIRIGGESLFSALHPVGSVVLGDSAPAQGVWESAGALAGTTAWRRTG